jgi:hypothetical protein
MAETVQDDVLGQLIKSSLGSWETDVAGITYDLRSLAALPHAHHILAKQDIIEADAKCYAAETMLENKNTNWADESDSLDITAEQFADRITLQSIVDIDEDGSFAMFFEDGDLFAGHAILGEHNAAGQCYSASIQG